MGKSVGRPRKIDAAEHQAVQRELLRVQRELRVAKEALKPVPAPPRPIGDYSLRFPLDKEHWVSVQSNRPLEAKHWERLYRVLDLQRATLCEPISYQVLIPDEADAA